MPDIGMKPLILAMPTLKLVYVNSPRCASTTTLNILRDLLDIEPEVEEKFGKRNVHALFFYSHSSKIDTYRNIASVPSEYLSFTVVRNPFARVVSFYDGIYKGGGSKIADKYNYSEGESFKDFVKKIYNLGMAEFEEHLIEQYRGFRAKHLDKLVHLEHYEEEIKDIVDVKNVPHWPYRTSKKDLPGSPRKKKYSSFYDEETKEMVGELYSKDLEMLGYEF